MPLACFPHYWTEPFYERVKVDRVTRMPITRLHLVQRCTQCGEVREVYPESYSSGRVRRIPFSNESA